jgi:formylglycine-generating enzyme required for sulfatase activity
MKTTRKATALAALSALACLLCMGLTGCPMLAPQVLPFFLDEPADSGDPLEATYLGSVTVTPPLVLEGSKFRDPAGGPRPGASGFTIWPPERVRVMQWLWDFGDDTTGEGQVVDHLYAAPGCYTVTLTVILSNGMQGVYSREVCFASGDNNPPVAVPDAPETAPAGSDVQLDGQESFDPDDDDITFLWSIVSAPAGSAATLDDPTSPTPKLLGPIPGTYVLSLQVSDGDLDSTVVEVIVVIEEPEVNHPPVADAGLDFEICQWTETILDGTGSSDPDDDPLTYAWALVSAPQGSTAELGDPTSPNPTFVPNVPGDYVFELVVDDGHGIPLKVASAPDSVTVTVYTPTLEMTCVQGNEFILGPSQEEIDDEDADDNELYPMWTYVQDFEMGLHEVTNCMFAHVLNYALQEEHLSSIPLVGKSDVPAKANGYSGGDVYFLNRLMIQIAGGPAEGEYCDIEYDPVKDHFYVAARDGRMLGRHPVNEVTWYGATAFCVWLDEIEETGEVYYGIYDGSWAIYGSIYFGTNGYRLPFEREWEYAAAWDAPNMVEQHWRYAFDNPTIDTSWANFSLFNPFGFAGWPFTTPVAYYNGVNAGTNDARSPQGMYDMTGNVSEWVNEELYPYLTPSKQQNGSDPERIIRGGSWQDTVVDDMRTARRRVLPSETADASVGFRVARYSYECGGDNGYYDK